MSRGSIVRHAVHVSQEAFVVRSAPLAAWLRGSARSDGAVPSVPGSWDRLAEAACRAGLAGLFREAAARQNVHLPERVAARLRHRATTVAAANLNQMHQLRRLLLAFQRAGIPVMLLKGAALNLTVYDRPDLRPMSDLDLLIQPGMVEAAVRLLQEQGYRRGFGLVRSDFFPRYHCEVEFLGGSPGPVRIDLHARPFRPLRISRTMPDDALWHDAEVVHHGEVAALVPRPELMLIHLAAHAAFHGCSMLLWLYDIKRLVDCRADTIDWPLVARSARRWRLSLPILQAVSRAGELLGPIAPDAFAEELKSHKPSWRDRLTLAQAPRDADSPVTHVMVNLLCTPGVRFRTGYVLAHLIPGREHLAGVYPFRHRGWTVGAYVWRVVRALGRGVLEPLRSLAKRAAGPPRQRRECPPTSGSADRHLDHRVSSDDIAMVRRGSLTRADARAGRTLRRRIMQRWRDCATS